MAGPGIVRSLMAVVPIGVASVGYLRMRRAIRRAGTDDPAPPAETPGDAGRIRRGDGSVHVEVGPARRRS